jgi:hypothetical protein
VHHFGARQFTFVSQQNNPTLQSLDSLHFWTLRTGI